MKALSKIIILLAVVLSFNLTVYANMSVLELFNQTYKQTNEADSEFLEFEITSGLLKDFEGTFDSERTLIGSAPKSTKVYISIYKYDEAEESFTLLNEDCQTVGSSGIFSSIIDLALGENYVLVTGIKDSYIYEKTALLKRKDKDIKLELERGANAALPSQIFPIGQ